MAKCYVVELGLDGNVAPRYDGTYSHAINLIQVEDFTAITGKPWVFTDFQKDDLIVFRACDYTERRPGELYPKLELKGIFVKFLKRSDPKCFSDCVDEPLLCSGKDYYPEEGDPSLVIKDKTGWRFFGTSLNAKTGFLGNLFGSTSTDTKTERFCRFKEGTHRALLRVDIIATYTYLAEKDGEEKEVVELRWFTHDPEIFVGEGGPPDRH